MSKEPQIHDEIDQAEMHPMAKLLFGWVLKPKMGNYVFGALAVLSVLLISIDFSDIRHPHNEAESYIGFYGIYGFFAFAFAVLMGWPLGRLLRRDENYYGDQDEDDGAGR